MIETRSAVIKRGFLNRLILNKIIPQLPIIADFNNKLLIILFLHLTNRFLQQSLISME
jgi:hypothetical protein